MAMVIMDAVMDTTRTTIPPMDILTTMADTTTTVMVGHAELVRRFWNKILTHFFLQATHTMDTDGTKHGFNGSFSVDT